MADHYYRKVIRISAEESPNIRYARAQQQAGLAPTGKDENGEDVLPGVINWEQYQHHLRTFDEVMQCIALRGQFWKGRDSLLFPPDWLTRSDKLAATRILPSIHERNASLRPRFYLGCDPAEGGDSSAWSVVDEEGLIELLTLKTPDTNVVPYETIRLIDKYNIDPKDVVFDRGGGGKQHADRLRDGVQYQGQLRRLPGVRTVAFGEGMTPDPRKQRNRPPWADRMEVKEDRAAYANRRAEMYGELSDLFDPAISTFAVSFSRYPALRKQLAVFPRLYKEGTMYLPPKRRKPGEKRSPEKPTLEELIGHSPDEADSLALAVWAMNNHAVVVVAGGVR